jgi:hypothetical protein
MVIAVFRRLVTVTAWGWLAAPTGTVPKLNAAGVSRMGGMAVPVSPTVCGADCALLVMVTAPFVVPKASGVKVTSTVQLSPAANVEHWLTAL